MKVQIFGFLINISKIRNKKWVHYCFVRNKKKNYLFVNGKLYKGNDITIDFWYGNN